jgi:hypothetical protein
MKSQLFELTGEDLAGISLVLFNDCPVKELSKISLQRIKGALDDALDHAPRHRRGTPHARWILKQAIREAA